MYNNTDKARNLRQYNRYALAKTLSMFEYTGLPKSLPAKELEKILQNHGYAFITEHEGELYAFHGGLGGVEDVYGNPTQIVISNPALNLFKTLSVKDDGVLLYNDDMQMGVLPLLDKYNSAMVENDINLMMTGYNSRLQTLISAPDDKTKASAESFIAKMQNGEVGVIGESALFDGIKVHNNGQSQGSNVTALIEYQQYLKGSLANEIGLKSNFNMKRERLTSGEVDAVDDVLYPFVDNMMACRIEGIEAINEKYGTTIDVDYGSIWSKKNREIVDGVLEDETGEESWDETKDESSQESSQESLDESSENYGSEVSKDAQEEIPAEDMDDEMREIQRLIDAGEDQETIDELLIEYKEARE